MAVPSPADGRGSRAPVPTAPLVSTKLQPPTAIASYRSRDRISGRLDRALDDATHLTLVSAPPGYGKSVAVAGWLASREVPHAWLSLDAGDNDPVRFVRYLTAALGAVRPGIEGDLGLLALPPTSAPELVGAALIDAIATNDDPFVIVLDDYHVVTAEPVHALVRFLIERGPPFAHPVVATREDPPFRLARLRAHGRLVELRADELRYTEDEARRYLAEIPGVELDTSRVRRLVDRTEGWIAGLQLAAIALRERPDAAALVDAFTGSQRFVLDYLAAEVLDGLDPDLRAFLMRISVADRFNCGLCRELSGRDDSVALLERAERTNLFLVPLDLERHWYRFHHLFADYLRSLLDDAERQALHERAAEYLEREGLDAEAIGHALAAGSFDRAVRLLEREARPTYQAGELATLLGWLGAVPVERVAASPELASLRACALFFSGHLELAAQTCNQGEAACAADEAGTAQLLAIHALMAAFGRAPEAARLAQDALARLGEDAYFRTLALQALGTAQLMAGDLENSIATTLVTLEASLPSRQVTVVISALTMQAHALNLTGRRSTAEALCRRVIAESGGTAAHLPPGVWYGAYFLGIMRYEANDLDESLRELERAWEGAGRFGFGRVLFGASVEYLALARLASGYPEDALDALRTLRREARTAGMASALTPQLAQIEARAHLLRGDLAAAARWADEVGRDPADWPASDWPGLARLLTLGRVRLAQGRVAEAAVLLRAARTAATRAGDIADLISIGVLDAGLAERTGDRSGAQGALEAAIRLAAPEGYVRRVIDDGREMSHLLPGLRWIAPDFVDDVVAGLAPAPIAGPGRKGSASLTLRHDEDGGLIEALTARELDVLRLMAAGCSDGAVADTLVVSVATAKWHAAHIRSKLRARSRTQAVLRAQQLGLV